MAMYNLLCSILHVLDIWHSILHVFFLNIVNWMIYILVCQDQIFLIFLNLFSFFYDVNEIYVVRFLCWGWDLYEQTSTSNSQQHRFGLKYNNLPRCDLDENINESDSWVFLWHSGIYISATTMTLHVPPTSSSTRNVRSARHPLD